MPFMTVGGSSDIDAGTYPGTLIAINEKRIPSKFSTSPDGMDDSWEWVFALEDGTEVNGLTSTYLTPKSRAFGYLVALVGKEKVTSGAGFELSDLIGKTALVSGSGYAPGSTVEVWLGVPARLLGTVTVGADGSFEASVMIPVDIDPGRYTVQAEGWAANGVDRRTVGTGLSVSATGLPTTGRGDVTIVVAMFALVVGVIARRARRVVS